MLDLAGVAISRPFSQERRCDPCTQHRSEARTVTGHDGSGGPAFRPTDSTHDTTCPDETSLHTALTDAGLRSEPTTGSLAVALRAKRWGPLDSHPQNDGFAVEPMTGSLGGAFGAQGGPDSIPDSVSSLRSEPMTGSLAVALRAKRWGPLDSHPQNDGFAVEPMTGIEPAYLAWEASALPLSYIGERPHCSRRVNVATRARPSDVGGIPGR